MAESPTSGEAEIRVEKTFTASDDGDLIRVELSLENPVGAPAAVLVEDTIPGSVSQEDLGFHDVERSHWSLNEPDSLRYSTYLPASGSKTATYLIRGSHEHLPALASPPAVRRSRWVVSESANAMDTGVSGRKAGGERAGKASLESADGGTPEIAANQPATDRTEPAPGGDTPKFNGRSVDEALREMLDMDIDVDRWTGSEDHVDALSGRETDGDGRSDNEQDRRSAGSAAADRGGAGRSGADDGAVSPSDGPALETDPRIPASERGEVPTSVAVRLKRLESQLTELASYKDGLESFLDEHGTAQELLKTIRHQQGAIVDAVTEMRNRVGTVETTQADRERRLADLEASVGRLDSDAGRLSKRVDQTADRLETTADRVATTTDRLDEQATAIDDLRSIEETVRGNRESVEAIAERQEQFGAVLETLLEGVTNAADGPTPEPGDDGAAEATRDRRDREGT